MDKGCPSPKLTSLCNCVPYFTSRLLTPQEWSMEGFTEERQDNIKQYLHSWSLQYL